MCSAVLIELTAWTHLSHAPPAVSVCPLAAAETLSRRHPGAPPAACVAVAAAAAAAAAAVAAEAAAPLPATPPVASADAVGSSAA